ncbi:MAG: phosphoribosylaminoimidazolesuccinocarboxamide synthase [Candidatus Limnocylindrales bacterium]
MPTADAFVRSGKVRDLYELPDGRMVLVASDRMSAFDVVLPTEIPDKGRVLTGLSRFWFAETQAIVPNHLLETDPAALRDAWETPVASVDDWRGRTMICQNASVVPIEAVVRGYLAGSAWKEYQASGSVCGIALPSGLREADPLPEPIFTPATKAEAGEHDQNLDFDAMVQHLEETWILPAELAGPLAELVRMRAIALYRYATAIVARAGIVLADTKFEFGLGRAWGLEDEGVGPPEERLGRSRRPAGRRPTGRNWQRLEDQLILIDEALTPDSSRFWDAATYEPGRAQASFDKQFVRDYLETLDWDKTAPGPALPDDVIAGTRARYVEAFERITGASFARYLQEDVIAR